VPALLTAAVALKTNHCPLHVGEGRGACTLCRKPTGQHSSYLGEGRGAALHVHAPVAVEVRAVQQLVLSVDAGRLLAIEARRVVCSDDDVFRAIVPSIFPENSQKMTSLRRNG